MALLLAALLGAMAPAHAAASSEHAGSSLLLLVYRGVKPESSPLDSHLTARLSEKLNQMAGHQIAFLAAPFYQDPTWIQESLPRLIETSHASHVAFFFDWSKSLLLMGAADYLAKNGYSEDSVARATQVFFQSALPMDDRIRSTLLYQLGCIGFSRRIAERADPLAALFLPMTTLMDRIADISGQKGAKFALLWPGMDLTLDSWRAPATDSRALQLLNLLEPMKYLFYMNNGALTNSFQNGFRLPLIPILTLREDLEASDPFSAKDYASDDRQAKIADGVAAALISGFDL